eukprot:scaffold1016_cov203-Chaetoceros_neogracile.AAC.1
MASWRRVGSMLVLVRVGWVMGRRWIALARSREDCVAVVSFAFFDVEVVSFQDIGLGRVVKVIELCVNSMECLNAGVNGETEGGRCFGGS